MRTPEALPPGLAPVASGPMGEQERMTTLTGKQIDEAGLAGWAYLLGGLQTRIATADFASGLAIVNGIGAAAGRLGRHPAVDLRSTHVGVRLTSHDQRGVTDRDLELARTISELAADAGLTTLRTGVSRLELALDTPSVKEIPPFWGAVSCAPGRTAADGDRDGLTPTKGAGESQATATTLDSPPGSGRPGRPRCPGGHHAPSTPPTRSSRRRSRPGR